MLQVSKCPVFPTGCYNNQLTLLNLRWLGLRDQRVKNVNFRRLASKFVSTEASAFHHKSTQAHPSPGQTDSHVDPSVQPASSCESVGKRLNICMLGSHHFILFTVAILIIVAFVSSAITISVRLVWIRDRHTVITSVTHTISVRVFLVEILHKDAVILV